MIQAEETLYFLEAGVYLRIEGCALGVVLLEQLGGAQHLFLVLGELALVEVALQLEQLLSGERARLLAVVEHLAVVPPVANGLAMGREHGLGLREMLVALGHVEAVEPRLAGAEPLGGSLCPLVVEEEDVGGNGGVGREDAACLLYWKQLTDLQ